MTWQTKPTRRMCTILPFYGALVVTLLLETYVPAFSLRLPGLLK